MLDCFFKQSLMLFCSCLLNEKEDSEIGDIKGKQIYSPNVTTVSTGHITVMFNKKITSVKEINIFYLFSNSYVFLKYPLFPFYSDLALNHQQIL